MLGLNREREVAYTALLDTLILSLVWIALLGLAPELLPVPPVAAGGGNYLHGLLHVGYWVMVFGVFGLYRRLYLISRFDEFLKVVKSTIAAVLVLVLILLFRVHEPNGESVLDLAASVAPYGGIVGGSIFVNRFIIRTIQRAYARRGKGLHRAVIVGTGRTARMVFDELDKFKTMGLSLYTHLTLPTILLV